MTAALAIALAMLATSTMAEVVLVPGIGARTVVPCCGNNPNAPKVYVPGPHDRPALGPYYRGAAHRPVLGTALGRAVADVAAAGGSIIWGRDSRVPSLARSRSSSACPPEGGNTMN